MLIEIYVFYRKMEESIMMEFKNLSTYWIDKVTFCFVFDGGIDEDGDKYSILCEYHSDENKYIFIRWYEHDTTRTDFTEEQKEYIKAEMRKYMN